MASILDALWDMCKSSMVSNCVLTILHNHDNDVSKMNLVLFGDEKVSFSILARMNQPWFFKEWFPVAFL